MLPIFFILLMAPMEIIGNHENPGKSDSRGNINPYLSVKCKAKMEISFHKDTDFYDQHSHHLGSMNLAFIIIAVRPGIPCLELFLHSFTKVSNSHSNNPTEQMALSLLQMDYEFSSFSIAEQVRGSVDKIPSLPAPECSRAGATT